MNRTALLIIDMQAEMQFRINAGRDCVNPGAGDVVATLAAACRDAGVPVVHIRHRQVEAARPFHPLSPGFPAMPCAEAEPGEAVFVKTTSSPFASTDLEAHLRGAGIDSLWIVGAVAGYCVNTTTRVASDLGFDCVVVRDGVLGFDLPEMPARLLFDATMALLGGDFAQIVDSGALLDRLSA